MTTPLGYLVFMALISVVETYSYLHDAERLLNEGERSALVLSLATNPLQGVLIKGTGGLRKMRLGLSGRGKRGGGRVVYWYHSTALPIVLLAMFAKNEAADLSSEERRLLARVADQLIDDFGGKR
jgi:hypothetical protein